jgi:NAD(P)-dependent dehydrogenase (short-subunit alcohol dehydrogenase family)
MIPEQVQERLAGMHALQRLGSEEDAAEAALFLASRRMSGWLSGTVIDVAGGPLSG